MIQNATNSGGCNERVTRAELLSLRTNSQLDTGCHYTITNPNAQGNLDLQEVTLHATDVNVLGTQADLLTSHDTVAWEGMYDIDADDVLEVTDNLENHVTNNSSVITFPWGIATVYNNEIHSATINYTGGTLNNVTMSANSNLTISGGTLSESNIEQDAQVTISSGTNYENNFGTSVVFTQSGTGYIRYSNLEGNTTWTNGNVDLSNVQSFSTAVNTTGSTGTISNVDFNRAYLIGLQSISDLIILDSSFSDYSQITANSAARVYIYRGSAKEGGRYLISAGASYEGSYTSINSYGYIQVIQGRLVCNYNKVESLGYIQHNSTGLNRVERCVVSSQSRIRFLNTTTNNRIYYCSATSGGALEHRGDSSNCFMYYCNSDGLSEIYTNNSFNGRQYYCSASSRGRVYSQNNTRTHYQYYSNATSAGQVIMIDNEGSMRMYSIESTSQSIARLQNSTANGNWYYSRVDSYYYMYITRNGGTTSGAFGQGRRSLTVTNPVLVAPYASGSSWQNI